jgi:hypothetical protein
MRTGALAVAFSVLLAGCGDDDDDVVDAENTPAACGNGDDDDADGFVDCDDQDCLVFASCAGGDGGADGDADGGDGGACTPPDGDSDGHDAELCGGDDCDDANPAAYPGAADSVGDDVDQDCDGRDGVDADGDVFASMTSGGPDCGRTPAATRLCRRPPPLRTGSAGSRAPRDAAS